MRFKDPLTNLSCLPADTPKVDKSCFGVIYPWPTHEYISRLVVMAGCMAKGRIMATLPYHCDMVVSLSRCMDNMFKKAGEAKSSKDWFSAEFEARYVDPVETLFMFAPDTGFDIQGMAGSLEPHMLKTQFVETVQSCRGLYKLDLVVKSKELVRLLRMREGLERL